VAVKKKQFPVKIGFMTYIVLFDTKELSMIDRDYGDGEVASGRIVFEKGMIYIQEDMEAMHEKEVVLHEVSHGVNFQCGINDSSLKNFDEEHLVRVTSPVWMQIWADPENQEFRDYILGV